jgi:uncharacterized protein (DUF1697 family)
MRYVALLRGVNVGKERRVDMKKLKATFESLGYVNVSTYINSGNIIFESKDQQKDVLKKIKADFKKNFSFDVPFLVKTEKEIRKISNAIPKDWKNDTAQRSDVAFLFPEIDFKKTVDDLPVKKEFIDIRYVKGAIFWNISRKNYNKSGLNKIVGSKLYNFMTIRNVNTCRYLIRAIILAEKGGA